MSEFAHIELALIEPSRTNPRKHFDPVKLAELAESIKATGVHQPVMVRPLPGDRVQETSFVPHTVKQREVRPVYELVCGERRLRASHLAKVENIPALIRTLTDEQVLEIQIVENLQRDDLTELEEAEGFEALMAHSGVNAEAVAIKIGRSRSHVFGRLKLLDLCTEAKNALREGEIDASRAVLIARIPDAKLQMKALDEASKPIGMHGDQVSSVRAFQSWLQANVMLRLENATFQITDTRLVKAAGSCKDCPKRTGANPDLFADVNSADLCTDPVCFHSKEAAHRDAMVSKAEAKGMRLIEGKEAKEICGSGTSGKLDGYLPLNQVRQDAVVTMKGGSKSATLRDLLGKNAPSPVLIEHPVSKELIEAVPAEEAEAMLVMHGLVKANQQHALMQSQIGNNIAGLQQQLAAKADFAARNAIYTAVIDGVRATPDKQVLALLGGDVLRAWLEAQLGTMIDTKEMAELLGYTLIKGADEMDDVGMHIRACSVATLVRALVIWMVSDDKPSFYGRNADPTIVNALTSALKLDTPAIQKAAKAETKADVAKQIKALQAELKAKTTPALTTQSAEPSKGEGGAKTKEAAKPTPNSKTQAAAPRGSKAKTTTAEAITGIAAAMQSAEDQATTASPDAPGRAGKPGVVEAPSDPLFDRAVRLVTKERKVSVQALKAALGVGQAKAQGLIQLLEQFGKVSAPNGSGIRTVLVSA